MRSILQLCVMVLMLLGAGNRAWGKVAVGQNIAVRGFAEGGAFGNQVDEPPALMSSGEAAAWGYDCTLDVRDGPNVYAYVKQNPWTSFDPLGLEEKKPGFFKRIGEKVKKFFGKGNSDNKTNKTEPSQSAKNRQALAEELVITGGSGTHEDEAVVEKELAKLSESRLSQMKKNGTKVIACRGSVTDYWTNLKKQQPRGWAPGKTWDIVPGGQSGKEVVVATTGEGNNRRVPVRGEGHGSVNMTLHEAGHTFEDEGHNSNDFKAARQVDVPKMDAYFQQSGHAGESETFAEGFAHYHENSSAMSRKLPNLFKFFDSKENPPASTTH